MAGTNVMQASSLAPKVLFSGQLPDTASHILYTAPSTGSAIIKHGVVCNISASPVNVSISVVPNGGTANGTHLVVSSYPLAGNNSLGLTELLDGCCLGPGDAIYAQAQTGATIDIVLTGVEAS